MLLAIGVSLLLGRSPPRFKTVLYSKLCDEFGTFADLDCNCYLLTGSLGVAVMGAFSRFRFRSGTGRGPRSWCPFPGHVTGIAIGMAIWSCDRLYLIMSPSCCLRWSIWTDEAFLCASWLSSYQKVWTMKAFLMIFSTKLPIMLN